MALFRKKQEEPAEPEPARVREGWTVSQGERDGASLLLRFNGEAWEADTSELPVRFGVAVRFRKPRRDGFPDESDFGPLEQIEDAIDASLSDGRGVLGFVVTTGGMREFVGYVRNKAVVESVWQAAQAAAPRHEVQAYGRSDPEWQAYQEFGSTP